MQKPYEIFAARSEEDNDGWIWFADPPLPTRTIVRVKNPKAGRVVYCQSRKVDTNFLTLYNTLYNDRPRTRRKIENEDGALVISEWYRSALGGFATTSESRDQVKLDIKPARLPGWRDLRAACHHPDIAVRAGVRLGVLGVSLGLLSLVPALQDLADLTRLCSGFSFIAIAIVGAVIGFLACRGVKRPAL